MAKTRRLQVLLEPTQFERLDRISNETGASIGSLVRDAVERAYPDKALARSAAIDRFLDSDPVPMGDWALEKEIIEDMWGSP